MSLLPRWIVPFHRRLSPYPASAVLTLVINRMAWETLRTLDWAPLEGRTLELRLNDSGLRLQLEITATGLRPLSQSETEVIFSADTADFLRLALRLEDPDTLFFNRRLLIEGDTDLGLQLKNRLDRIDFEALLQQLPPPLRWTVLRLRERLATPLAFERGA